MPAKDVAIESGLRTPHLLIDSIERALLRTRAMRNDDAGLELEVHLAPPEAQRVEGIQ